MVSKRFFLLVFTRVILLVGTIIPFSIIFLRPDLLFTQIILLSVIISQVVELTYFVNRTNEDLSRFLSAIQDGDFSINFSTNERVRSFRNLHNSFKKLIETLKELETQKAAQFQFLNQLVNQIEFGIITFNDRNEIELMNKKAEDLLEIPNIRLWQKVNNPNYEFLRTLLGLPGSGNQLIEGKVGGQQRSFSVRSTTIVIREETFRIFSFQDIRSEIQQKEIEAWHKLIRILTHEIMNSVTPLVSLTDTVLMLMNEETMKSEEQEDIQEAIQTIKTRSEGILKFVSDYRKLTRIPKPELEQTTFSHIVKNVLTLMEADASKSDISLQSHDLDIGVQLDRVLIEQVILNLVKNAIESLKSGNKGLVKVFTEIQSDRVILNIEDNGPGIPAERLERIFVPFYTTKEDGSGIGLSVCRQIMNLHGGFIEVNSIPSKKTVFSLNFPATDLPPSSES